MIWQLCVILRRDLRPMTSYESGGESQKSLHFPTFRYLSNLKKPKSEGLGKKKIDLNNIPGGKNVSDGGLGSLAMVYV